MKIHYWLLSTLFLGLIGSNLAFAAPNSSLVTSPESNKTVSSPSSPRKNAAEISKEKAVPLSTKQETMSKPDESKDAENSDKTAKPQNVLVSIYVLNVGKYDVATGTFTIDFYLDMHHEVGVDPTNFEFINGRANSTDPMIITPTEHFYRIQADLISPVDLKQYPFDHQKLFLIIEDKKNSIDKLQYIALQGESELDDSINFIGWDIDSWTTLTRIHDYPKWNEKYSQFVFEIEISRIAMNSFMKTFLPVFFIVLIVLSSFTLGPDQASTRLGMAGSGLVASVMFHVSIASQIPPVGYLTFADKFMALTYGVTLVSFLINVVILAAQRRDNQKLIYWIHRSTEVSMFILVPLAYILLFIFVH